MILFSLDTFVAIFKANEDLPMLGLAAITTKLPSCNPASIESRSAKSVASPESPVPMFSISSIFSIASLSTSETPISPSPIASSDAVNIDCSASSITLDMSLSRA